MPGAECDPLGDDGSSMSSVPRVPDYRLSLISIRVGPSQSGLQTACTYVGS